MGWHRLVSYSLGIPSTGACQPGVSLTDACIDGLPRDVRCVCQGPLLRCQAWSLRTLWVLRASVGRLRARRGACELGSAVRAVAPTRKQRAAV